MNQPIGKASTARLDDYCFWAIVIDIFYLPYYTAISVSCSLPIMIVWYLLYGRRTHSCIEHKWFPIAVLLMIVSTLISLVYTGDALYETSFLTSVKRLLQYISSFWYFFFMQYYLKKRKIRIDNVVFWAIAFMAFIAALYYFFPSQFASIKAVINPADNHTRRWLTGMYLSEYRYNFFWSDPNNVGYATVSLFLFYISENKENGLKKYVSFIMLVFILFCTMSIGAILIAFVTVSLHFIITLWEKRTISVKKAGKNVLILILAIVATFALSGYISTFFKSNTVISFMNRTSIYASSDNITGGRLTDLKRSLTMMNPLFAIIGSGKEGFSAENGHIYLICMYGFPTYCYFMYVLFSKRRGLSLSGWLVIIPMLVGFTMNIAIIEQKFLLVLLCMQAYYSSISGENSSQEMKQRRRITRA